MIHRISFVQGLMALCLVWVAAVLILEKKQPTADIPDFASFQSVVDKKQAFFGYFSPIINAENDRLQALRENLQRKPSQSQLEQLGKKYRVEISQPATEQQRSELLKRIDSIPSSLVLAQAAIESAWGTSRFAREGYNFFGQWCFKKGCGLVPSARNEGAVHEVRVFDSPEESVRAYFQNINSHPTYAQLRELRAQARAENRLVHGCILAAGLSKYSERGKHYIDEIRQMIRVNKLSSKGSESCRAGEKKGVE